MLPVEQLRLRLQELDDPERLEFPRDYDQPLTQSTFTRLTAALQDVFDGARGADGQAQDASYHADVTVPAATTAGGHPIWVRMSNFGSLVTAGVDGNLRLEKSRELMSEEDIELIDQACSSARCVFVPLGVLLERYEGPTSLEEGIPDELLEQHEDDTDENENEGELGLWFNRFFDYM